MEKNSFTQSELFSSIDELRKAKDRITLLEKAILDLLYANSHWPLIKAQTGESDQRCKEIEALYNEILKKEIKKEGI